MPPTAECQPGHVPPAAVREQRQEHLRQEGVRAMPKHILRAKLFRGQL